MNKIYEQAKDLHVRNYEVFGNGGKLYYDAEFTKQVTQADMIDAFVKGALLIVVGADKMVPVVLSGDAVKTVGEDGALAFWTALVPVEE